MGVFLIRFLRFKNYHDEARNPQGKACYGWRSLTFLALILCRNIEIKFCLLVRIAKFWKFFLITTRCFVSQEDWPARVCILLRK